MKRPQLDGAGLGLRREHMLPLMTAVPAAINFFEISPENYLDLGGKRAKDFRWFTERYPFVAHGLSLSIGGPDPLDEAFLLNLPNLHDIGDIPALRISSLFAVYIPGIRDIRISDILPQFGHLLEWITSYY